MLIVVCPSPADPLCGTGLEPTKMELNSGEALGNPSFVPIALTTALSRKLTIAPSLSRLKQADLHVLCFIYQLSFLFEELYAGNRTLWTAHSSISLMEEHAVKTHGSRILNT